uniref:SET domain-containing protein n=1 Tax=Steinernema glaseri TaxID=37863 RepID=A0A1I7XXS1_9BILA
MYPSPPKRVLLLLQMCKAKLEALINWAKSKGAELDPTFEFQLINDSKGYGAVALEDMKASDENNVNVMFSTPICIEISSDNIKSDPYFQEVAQYSDRLSNTELVILALCVEKRKGESSTFWPYVDYLPDKLNLGPMNIDLTEFPVDMRKEYVVDCISKRRSLRNISNNVKSFHFNEEEIEWAYNIVHSRSLIDKDNVTLQPVADLFNASQEPKVSLKTQCSTKTERERKYYNLGLIIADVKKGDELCISYDNSLNNVCLWFKHGFTFENNENNRGMAIEADEVRSLLKSVNLGSIEIPDGIFCIIENRRTSAAMEKCFKKISKASE